MGLKQRASVTVYVLTHQVLGLGDSNTRIVHLHVSMRLLQVASSQPISKRSDFPMAASGSRLQPQVLESTRQISLIPWPLKAQSIVSVILDLSKGHKFLQIQGEENQSTHFNERLAKSHQRRSYGMRDVVEIISRKYNLSNGCANKVSQYYWSPHS